MEKNKNTAVIIIIGAGPAGLTAAYEILKRGNGEYSVVVLEETSHIGGISRTVRHNGNRMDIGGHRFFSKDDRVNEFWLSLMPLQGSPSYDDKTLGRESVLSPGGPDPETDENVMLVRKRVSRIFFNKKFFAYPVTLSPETLKNMGFLKTLRAGGGYLFAAVFKKKETNLRNFYINRFGKPLYEMFFEDYTKKVWGVDPKEISADWGAQRVKGLSLFKAALNFLTKPFKGKGTKNVETSLIEQFYYPKKGPGQLWEVLADEITKLGGSIITDCKVDKINASGGKIVSVESGGRVFPGDGFFSSMPVKDLVLGMNGVPEEVSGVAACLPYRDFITVGLLCDKLNIKNETKIKTLGNIVPDCWIYVQDRFVKLGRLQIFNNWSPYMVSDPDNKVWIGLEYFCGEGDEMWNMSDSEFIDFAKGEVELIGITEKRFISDAVRVKVKKAYPSYFGSYKDMGKVAEYLNSVENLYCIGRNGLHRYNNMDHSMLTAMAAVDSLLLSRPKSDIWQVNAEEDYHEKK
ncbi:MAG: NAD(P)/FAD-dependent oxidoreductase [Eubacteriales bacterium]